MVTKIVNLRILKKIHTTADISFTQLSIFLSHICQYCQFMLSLKLTSYDPLPYCQVLSLASVLLETLRSCTKVLIDYRMLKMIFGNFICALFSEFSMCTKGSGRLGSFPWRGEVFHREWIFCDDHPKLLLHWKNPNARQVPSVNHSIMCDQKLWYRSTQ